MQIRNLAGRGNLVPSLLLIQVTSESQREMAYLRLVLMGDLLRWQLGNGSDLRRRKAGFPRGGAAESRCGLAASPARMAQLSTCWVGTGAEGNLQENETVIKAGFSPPQPNRLPWHFSANLSMRGAGRFAPCLPPALPILALQDQTGDLGSRCCSTRRLFLANRS